MIPCIPLSPFVTVVVLHWQTNAVLLKMGISSWAVIIGRTNSLPQFPAHRLTHPMTRASSSSTFTSR